MPHLILIRHSISQQQPGVSAHEWALTDEGRARCAALAEHLRPYAPQVVLTSAEPKAQQTAEALAAALNLPVETEIDLHEHLRRTAIYFNSAVEFQARVTALLTHPDELVFGEETGSAAAARFTTALNAALARHPDATVAAVTHGTVLALFLARAAGVEPVAFWRALGMPAYVVLALPGYEVLRVENDVR